MYIYIIDNVDVIKKITGKSIYKKIILHVNNNEKEAKYESDYTLYELTERLNYFKVQPILNNIKNLVNTSCHVNEKLLESN